MEKMTGVEKFRINHEDISAALKKYCQHMPENSVFMLPARKFTRILETGIMNRALAQQGKHDYGRGASDMVLDFIAILFSVVDEGTLKGGYQEAKNVINDLVAKYGTGVEGVDKLEWGEG